MLPPSRRLDVALVAVLALLAFWAPLPFGSITRSGQMIVEIGAFLALALCAFSPALPSAIRAVRVPAAAVAAIAALGLLQSLPWPIALVRAISPHHAALEEEAARLAGLPVAGTLSLAPSASRAAALTFAAAAAVMIAAAVAAAGRNARRVLLAAPIAAALVQVLLGVRGLFRDATDIWGYEIGASGGRLRGTFVDPDHAAYYLEMALALTFAWCFVKVRRAGLLPARPDIVPWLSAVAPPALVWLLLFTALAFTGSRGGLLAAILGVLIQGLLLALERRRLLPGTLGALAAVAGLAFVMTVSVEQGLGRFMTSVSRDAPWDQMRARAYQLSLDLVPLFPWTGTGLSTFRDAFPLVQAADLEGSWWHAHCDYLELLVTAGTIGAAIVAAAGLWLMARLLTDLGRRRHIEERAAVLAALGALAALGLHEAVDFGLAMPANALTLALLCGAALAPSTDR